MILLKENIFYGSSPLIKLKKQRKLQRRQNIFKMIINTKTMYYVSTTNQGYGVGGKISDSNLSKFSDSGFPKFSTPDSLTQGFSIFFVQRPILKNVFLCDPSWLA